jgi:hypothetical protein
MIILSPHTHRVIPLIAVTTSHVHRNPAASISSIVCHSLGDNHPVTHVFMLLTDKVWRMVTIGTNMPSRALKLQLTSMMKTGVI